MKKLPLLTLLALLAACGGGSSSNPGQGVLLTLNTTKAAALINQKVQFTASVPADWSITEPNGGSITNEGLYTTPVNTGTFHIVAKSRADASQSATASVDVSAEFLSLQKLVGGTNLPFSVTPVLAKLAANGTWSTAGLIDPSTNKPFDTNAVDIFLSPDGKKAAFTALIPDIYSGDQPYFFNIAVASADGATITQLTHNEQNQNAFVIDMYPQISPDGQTIIDTHVGPDPVLGIPVNGIAKMNLDGTNFQSIFQQLGVDTWMPTYSPDGKMIAVEMAQRLGDGDYDGIATMNADGTNVVQLTGLLDTSNYTCWDEMPAYTSDGKKIVFARECWPSINVGYSQLFSMNPDGSGVTPIHGTAVGGFISCQPRIFANGSVVFSSNVAAPGTDAFDMYSILQDGTKLARITNNNLYDGFSIYWMNYTETSSAALVFRSHSPVQQRLDHLKRLQQLRAR